MPIFIKTEKFNKNALRMSYKERSIYLEMHKEWVLSMVQSGHYIHSGYLINDKKMPGGGGLLIIESENYLTAKNILINDPMIKNKLVIWNLNEWIPINHLG